MDYGMIGKIEKAKRYAEERDRIRFNQFSVTFDGDNTLTPSVLSKGAGPAIATSSKNGRSVAIPWRLSVS